MNPQRSLRVRSRISLLSAATLLVAGQLAACTPAHHAHGSPNRPIASGRVQRWIRNIDRSGGRLLQATIPGTTSGFVARAAPVYLPPAARQRGRRLRLPVLLLLHGEPGGPHDWIDKSTLLHALNRFANRHHGAAPVVVMPDINGARHEDSECVSTANGDVEKYLTSDVPAYVEAHYPVATSRSAWAIGGVSEGGMCSLMLALRHQDRFSAFVDLSGLTRPTLGRTDNRSATLNKLFGGSVSAYDEHDPLWLLARHRYPDLAGWFATGADDTHVRAAQEQAAAAARRAGINTVTRVEPGAHDWSVWDRALAKSLPWLWGRLTRG